MTNIDITKRYQTRDGREVVIFEVSDKVYCKFRECGEWHMRSRPLNGRIFMGAENGSDLIPVKTWRAWKHGEAPKFFMVKAATNDGLKVLAIDSSKVGDWDNFFNNFLWLHEDGTTTPCGVCE
jgi:ribosomal protein L34